MGPRSAGTARLLRRIARQLLPPIVAAPLRRAVGARGVPADTEWEYRPDGWPADPAIRGWDAESVVSTQLARWPAFVRSVEAPAPFGVSNEAAGPTHLDHATHNTIISFGYVLGRTGHGRRRLSMLDWGGGIGHYNVYANALLPEVELDYHCRDLSRFAEAGREVQPRATFHDRDETALARPYDLVLASSSLHYSKDWRADLAKLASVTGSYLYVTRQPFVDTAASFVVVQRPHRYGYLTEYPGWFLNRREFLSAADGLGLELLREFLIAERPVVPGAPEQADNRGFLFAAPAGRAQA
jgi:putative methyltransferase (TIGR04325 family)